MTESILHHTFENGLKLVYFPWNTPVAYAGVFIAAGSRNETNEEQGLAHFIEHTLFKGTKKRSSSAVINRLESVGGELNAYTSREETVIYTGFLTKHSLRALELMSDILFNATFPEKELEKEKEVVIDEIGSYLDAPSEQIFDDFEEKLFPNQPFGANILGTPEKVRAFTQKDIFRFLEKHYHPEKMVVSYVGNMPFEHVKKHVEKIFIHKTHWESLTAEPAKNGAQFIHDIEKSVYQAHCVIGGKAPSMQSKEKTAMSLLNNYLGGPSMNAVFNMILREKNGYTYNNESHYTAYSDTGIFEIYFGTEKKSLNKCLKLIENELTKIRNNALSTAMLKRIQQQYCGQIAISADSSLNQMMRCGKHTLYTGKVLTMSELFREIENVTSSQILEIANTFLDFKKLSMLTYLPEKS